MLAGSGFRPRDQDWAKGKGISQPHRPSVKYASSQCASPRQDIWVFVSTCARRDRVGLEVYKGE